MNPDFGKLLYLPMDLAFDRKGSSAKAEVEQALFERNSQVAGQNKKGEEIFLNPVLSLIFTLRFLPCGDGATSVLSSAAARAAETGDQPACPPLVSIKLLWIFHWKLEIS